MPVNLIDSRSKRLKKIVLPKYKEDKKLSRFPINLEGGNILPEKFEEYIPLVRQLIKESPIRKGWGLLNIQEESCISDSKLGMTGRPILIVSNRPLCKGWNGKFSGIACEDNTIKPSLSKLKSSKSFDFKSNTLYLLNSKFVYETLSNDKETNQVSVSILLPVASNENLKL